MISNPFTRQVINHLPGQHNQAEHGKFYKGRRFSTSKRVDKRIYEGPFDTEEEAAVHSYVLDDLDNVRSNLSIPKIRDKEGHVVLIPRGDYLQEDINEANAGNLTASYGNKDIPVRFRILKPRPITRPGRLELMKEILKDIKSKRA